MDNYAKMQMNRILKSLLLPAVAFSAMALVLVKATQITPVAVRTMPVIRRMRLVLFILVSLQLKCDYYNINWL